jgi:maltose alpha-D-glucosyltransferase/alpha-amylase
MVRSLNYAAVAGRLDDIAAGGTPRADANDALARDWERRSVAAFLDGYWTTIAGRSSVPADPDQTRRLLDLFVLEKAFYEMSYELANRPLWLRIPLEGVQAILNAGHYARTANS